jgi:hypothetical protein
VALDRTLDGWPQLANCCRTIFLCATSAIANHLSKS